MIPLAEPNLSGNEARYLADCISSGYVSSVGSFVPLFEDSVAEVCGSDFAVAVNSGTSALHVSLTALGVRPGDLVIIPTYTFIATANAVSLCGATPWVLDIDDDSWGLCPDTLLSELVSNTRTENGQLVHTASGRRVSGVVAVHAAGHPARMTQLIEISNFFNLPLLVDAAGAIGSEYRKLSLGMHAPIATLSFNGNKTFTTGGGGAVITNDEHLAARIRHLSTTARVGTEYQHDSVGFNYRMTNLQASVGLAQLERATEFLSSKRQIGAVYTSAWAQSAATSFPNADWALNAHWMSGVVVPEVDPTTALRLVTHLESEGIQSRRFWMPIHLQLPYATAPKSNMPVADAVWKRVVCLPCSTSLKREDQELVIHHVGEFLKTLE